MADITVSVLHDWLRRFQTSVAENREHLTQLDSAIGDADHGTNLHRGMTAVISALDAPPPTAAADLFKRSGMALVSNVGGASGPLLGTFFLRLAAALGPVESVSAEQLGAGLRAGLTGVEQRGKAERGDKTLLDALAPAVDAWDAVSAANDAPAAAAAAAAAAAVGRDATGPLVARKGRASYLGDRSAGHIDPGAASTALLFQTLADALAGPRAAE